MSQELLVDLAKAKAIFQQRAILAAMEIIQHLEQCDVCGDYHGGDAPRECETGDGV